VVNKDFQYWRNFYWRNRRPSYNSTYSANFILKIHTMWRKIVNYAICCWIHTGYPWIEGSIHRQRGRGCIFNSRQTIPASEQIAEINLTTPDWRRQSVIRGCRRNIGDPWRAMVTSQQSVSGIHLSQTGTVHATPGQRTPMYSHQTPFYDKNVHVYGNGNGNGECIIWHSFCSTSHSRRWGMDHTVLPAIIPMPAFTS